MVAPRSKPWLPETVQEKHFARIMRRLKELRENIHEEMKAFFHNE